MINSLIEINMDFQDYTAEKMRSIMEENNQKLRSQVNQEKMEKILGDIHTKVSTIVPGEKEITNSIDVPVSGASALTPGEIQFLQSLGYQVKDQTFNFESTWKISW